MNTEAKERYMDTERELENVLSDFGLTRRQLLRAAFAWAWWPGTRLGLRPMRARSSAPPRRRA